MPKGVFNMIYGAGVGEALVKHPAIQAVGFTGSLKGGRALCDMAAARPQPIPVFAEMSSINPVLVLPEALQVRGEKIASELAASVVLGCGQFCTNPGLVIGIRSPEFSAFIESLSAVMADQPGQTMLNAGTLTSYAKGVQALLAHPHITHLAGREQQGKQAQPQLFKADVSLLLNGDPLLQEEVFGPTTVLVEVADKAELQRALQSLHGQLTATLIAEAGDLQTHGELLPLLEQKVGRVLFNGYPTGVEVCDAMVHGGPYPATSDARGTSVGSLAIERFLRPVCYQNCPDALLPEALEKRQSAGHRPSGRWQQPPRTGLKTLNVQRPPVGASLLAIAAYQSTNMLNLMASSRAGSLPQGGRPVSFNPAVPSSRCTRLRESARPPPDCVLAPHNAVATASVRPALVCSGTSTSARARCCSVASPRKRRGSRAMISSPWYGDDLLPAS